MTAEIEKLAKPELSRHFVLFMELQQSLVSVMAERISRIMQLLKAAEPQTSASGLTQHCSLQWHVCLLNARHNYSAQRNALRPLTSCQHPMQSAIQALG